MRRLLVFLLASNLQPIPGLLVWEPVATRPTTQIYKASCPGIDLEVEGFGHARPLDRAVRISVNGVELEHGLVADLKRELQDRSAVYRLSSRCTRPDVHLQLEIYKGRNVERRVVYSASRAAFGARGLLAHDPMSEIDELDFWFS